MSHFLSNNCEKEQFFTLIGQQKNRMIWSEFENFIETHNGQNCAAKFTNKHIFRLQSQSDQIIFSGGFKQYIFEYTLGYACQKGF